jgi:hypothetical protein
VLVDGILVTANQASEAMWVEDRCVGHCRPWVVLVDGDLVVSAREPQAVQVEGSWRGLLIRWDG